MKIIKIKITNANFCNDECMETLHDFAGLNDGDIVDAVEDKDEIYVTGKDGYDTFLRKCEYEVVE